jgi:hypothetical protein
MQSKGNTMTKHNQLKGKKEQMRSSPSPSPSSRRTVIVASLRFKHDEVRFWGGGMFGVAAVYLGWCPVVLEVFGVAQAGGAQEAPQRSCVGRFGEVYQRLDVVFGWLLQQSSLGYEEGAVA